MPVSTPLSLVPDSYTIEEPFGGDQLRRKVLADRLTGYIDRLATGAVIGIDAPWGEGKTWFGRHWSADLIASGRKVAYVDAFENDFAGEPFALVAAELANLLNDEHGNGKNLKKKASTVLKALLPVAGKTLVNIVGRLSTGSSNLTSDIEEAINEATEDVAAGAEKWIENRIDTLESERNSLRAFKSALADVAAKQEKPIVVFIDELDRCKPAFAVAMIERIKHLFDVPNLVFVLLVNRKQLEFAIEGQYGAGTDGQSYLGKFVHLWFGLPRLLTGTDGNYGRRKIYVTHILSKYRFDNATCAHLETTSSNMSIWVEKFDMSLRDVEKMCGYFALAGEDPSAVLTYLIATKIKFPDRIERLRIDDKRVHAECAEWLVSSVGELPSSKEYSWPANILMSISELHHLNAGIVKPQACNYLNKFRLETIGNSRPNDSIGLILSKIDLPFEMF